MKLYQPSDANEHKNVVREDPVPYGNQKEQEDARLLRIMNMTDMEKLQSFTRMLRMSALYKKAQITHKD